jgi:hypothetical protein
MNTGRLLPASINLLRGRLGEGYIGPHPLPVGDAGGDTHGAGRDSNRFREHPAPMILLLELVTHERSVTDPIKSGPTPTVPLTGPRL